MSCHEIGPAMGMVAGEVLREYDAGNINYDTAFRLLKATQKGVHYCDGNEGEWEEDFFKCRCGKCLKVVPEEELLYSTFDISVRDKVTFSYVCKDCYEQFGGDLSDTDDTYPSDGDKGYE